MNEETKMEMPILAEQLGRDILDRIKFSIKPDMEKVLQLNQNEAQGKRNELLLLLQLTRNADASEEQILQQLARNVESKGNELPALKLPLKNYQDILASGRYHLAKKL